MTDSYKSKNDNNKYVKSYRETKLEQNLWRCDCSDEGNHTDVNKHESSCRYGLWYVENDFHKGDQ